MINENYNKYFMFLPTEKDISYKLQPYTQRSLELLDEINLFSSNSSAADLAGCVAVRI